MVSASWDFLVAQTVKHLPTMGETRFRSLGPKDPLEKEMATHSSVSAVLKGVCDMKFNSPLMCAFVLQIVLMTATGLGGIETVNTASMSPC